ncbi:MAG: 30S ribosomal protein S9, partial [Candidatus Ratteibacteria bacterium]
FPLVTQQADVVKPLKVTELDGRFNVEVKSLGGGISGQVDAIKLGIARALVKYNPDLTSKLREFGLLTRDPRMKERKKYGQKGARKRFQWTKR